MNMKIKIKTSTQNHEKDMEQMNNEFELKKWKCK